MSEQDQAGHGAEVDPKDIEIHELKAQLSALREALTVISTALDAYGVNWCRSIAESALAPASQEGGE